MTERPRLMPVDEAVRRVVAGVEPVESEAVPLSAAFGRVLGAPLIAQRTQPPFDASAMDGYAVQAKDTRSDTPITVIGRSIAGKAFDGSVGPGQAVRIFTGAPVPAGADTILIQEDAETAGDDRIVAREVMAAGRHIRRAGLDFKAGDRRLARGERIGLRETALAAAINQTELMVLRRPRVALVATGNELVPPGGEPGPDQIVASTSVALKPYFESLGAEAHDLGIVPDEAAATTAAIKRAMALNADILVTIGGASVGDHDLVRDALAGEGMALDFWQIAMRPGKPLIFGRLNKTRVLGLPGNPVSSLVCALLFAKPLIAALLAGEPARAAEPGEAATLGADVSANDHRQDYMRATLTDTAGEPAVVTPLARQDSSMLSALALADCLLIRPPNAPAAKAGEPCRIIRLP